MKKKDQMKFYQIAIGIVLLGSIFLCVYSFSPFVDAGYTVDLNILLFDAVMAVLAALSSAIASIVAFRLLKKEARAVLGFLSALVLSISLISLSRVYFL